MNIFINNQPHEIKVASTLPEVFALLNFTSQKGVAIAINNNVIHRSEWEHCSLNENDKVTIIKATQGG